jgi:CRP/FNR family transcriptional regulator, anaerobic regulatory protein
MRGYSTGSRPRALPQSAACSGCGLSRVCLPANLDRAETYRLDPIIRRGRPLRTGKTLFHAGQRFEAIYAIRSGSAKTLVLAPDGGTSVGGFHMPGDVLGLEGIAQNRYPFSAIALEPTRYCGIPYRALQELSVSHRGLREELPKILSRALVRSQDRTQLVTARRARARLAAFLADLARRRKRSRLTSMEFRLPMMRVDIASYLHLTIETVSRTLSELQAEAVVAVRGRDIRILDAGRLATAAQGSIDDSSADEGRVPSVTYAADNSSAPKLSVV